MGKIKVALFIRGFHNGGIEKVFESYFTHMDLTPFEIHIITHMPNIPEKKKMFEDMGCIIHELSSVKGHKLNMTNFREYKELFSSVSFDIVHNNMPENLLPLLYARRYKIPVRILHSHNNYTEGYDRKNPLVRKWFLMGFALNAKNATHLVAVSKIAAESAFGKQPEGKVLILPNAIEMKKFEFNSDVREVYRCKLDVKEDFVIGHIGRYETEQKNQEFVLEVFRRLLKEKSNCKLLMIGSGKRLEEFRKIATEMELGGKVIFTGNVQNVQDYLQAMDIFLLPSRKEGLGIAAVEAQAAGLPCIVSDMVPDEVSISNDIKYIGISSSEDAREWVECILKYSMRERSAGSILPCGEMFDINKAVGMMAELYGRPSTGGHTKEM